MIIQRKFDYKPLERIDTPNGRRYIVGENQLLPSVTTILGQTKDMTGINEWRESVGEDKANKIVAEAGALGNNMHQNLENYILGKPMSGSFMAKALANVIIKKAFPKVNEVWGTEVSLYCKNLYAGTTDLTGVHDNIPSIMDFKNSIREKEKDWIEDYFMQLAAYATAHNEMYNTDIHRGVVMIATRDAKYQEFIIEGSEFTKYETMWAEKLCVYYDKYGNS
jgi:genome maintenance exonuclease 1